MKPHCKGLKIIPALCLFALTPAFSYGDNLPVIDGKKAVATVNGEPIALEEFNRALASLHARRAEENSAGRIDYSRVLRRLINARLILLEARNIGLDELPEIKNQVDDYSREALIQLLLKQQTKDIEADEKEAEALYKKAVKEWKIKAVRFDREEDAREMERALQAGADFDEAAKEAASRGKAQGGEEGEYTKAKDLLPPIAALVSKMEVGSVSPVMRIGPGFVILRIESVRFPEDVEAREWARQQALKRRREEAVQTYYEALKKKYVKVNPKLLDSLDFESGEPGFQSLLKDRRVVAKVKGRAPVTVGGLAKALEERFYHGIQRAIEGKRVNESKIAILEKLLRQEVFTKEVLKQKIDRTEEYKSLVDKYRDSVIFGVFVRKAVVPGIELKEEDLKTSYRDHIEHYLSPEMMRIDSLVFSRKEDAQKAVDKLRKGVDFGWLSANAEGQVDRNTKGLLSFGGRPLTTGSLPEGVRKAVSGGRRGDIRLYESPDGRFYVLHLRDVIPPRQWPFQEVRRKIRKKIFNEKVKSAVEDWADKLREIYEVEIYVSDMGS